MFEIEWNTPRHYILVDFLNNLKLDYNNNNYDGKCCNPSFGLATNAMAYKGTGQE
jgi:hypothetical protein